MFPLHDNCIFLVALFGLNSIQILSAIDYLASSEYIPREFTDDKYMVHIQIRDCNIYSIIMGVSIINILLVLAQIGS